MNNYIDNIRLTNEHYMGKPLYEVTRVGQLVPPPGGFGVPTTQVTLLEANTFNKVFTQNSFIDLQTSGAYNLPFDDQGVKVFTKRDGSHGPFQIVAVGIQQTINYEVTIKFTMP